MCPAHVYNAPVRYEVLVHMPCKINSYKHVTCQGVGVVAAHGHGGLEEGAKC